MVDQERLSKDLKELMDKHPAAMMQVIAGIMTGMCDASGAGQIQLTGEDDNGKPIYKLLFVMDEELIPIIENVVSEYDKTL